jgi:hypothetical protein
VGAKRKVPRCEKNIKQHIVTKIRMINEHVFTAQPQADNVLNKQQRNAFEK